MTATKKSDPIIVNTNPAKIFIKDSIRITRSFFCEVTAARETALSDVANMTTTDMVKAIPIEIATPKTTPSTIKSMDSANSMTITTPGHGIQPTTKAEITG